METRPPAPEISSGIEGNAGQIGCSGGMGLFRHKREEGDDWESRLQSPPQPIDPADVDLNAAETIVAELVSTIGDDAKMHAIFPRLVMASGAPDPDNDGAQYMALMADPHLPTKVWRWLLAVALRANEEGRYEITAKATLWAFVWHDTVVPYIEGSSFMMFGFDSAPTATLRELFEQGKLAFGRLPDDFVVARTAEPRVITARLLRPSSQE